MGETVLYVMVADTQNKDFYNEQKGGHNSTTIYLVNVKRGMKGERGGTHCSF